MGMPGAHRVCEGALERAEVGVSTAPAEAALRAAGGLNGISCDPGSAVGK